MPPTHVTRTLDQIKGLIQPTPSIAEDNVLQEIITAVSARMQDYMGHVLTAGTRTSEKHSGNGLARTINVNDGPIRGGLVVVEDGNTVDASEYVFDGYEIIHKTRAWSGIEPFNLEVTYDGGYLAIEQQFLGISFLACKQVTYEWKHFRKGDRIGENATVIDAGGTNQYIVEAWLPEVLVGMDNFRRVSIV